MVALQIGIVFDSTEDQANFFPLEGLQKVTLPCDVFNFPRFAVIPINKWEIFPLYRRSDDFFHKATNLRLAIWFWDHRLWALYGLGAASLLFLMLRHKS